VSAAAAPSAGFSLGPLTHYADPAAMAAWLASARAGAELIYASGPFLGTAPAAALAQQWQAAGAVELFQRRSGTRANCFDYHARRRAVAAVPGAISAEVLPDEALRVLDLLMRVAAERGQCPTNEGIARALDLKDWTRARYRFRQLIDAGRIRVIEPARFGARVIEIVATGARTAPTGVNG